MAPISKPKAGTASGRIHLLGSLELPHPADCGFDETRVNDILNLLPHLQNIASRDLQIMLTFVLYQGRTLTNPSFKPC